jgi:hypothetical protein
MFSEQPATVGIVQKQQSQHRDRSYENRISFEISTKEEPELILHDDNEQQNECNKKETNVTPKKRGQPRKIKSFVNARNKQLKELKTDKAISKLFHCDYCYKVFNFRSQILIHMKTHQESTNSRATKRELKHKNTETVKAKRTGAKKTKMPKHQIREKSNNSSKSKQYKCNVCKEIFQYRTHFSMHMEKHKNVLNKCPDCSEIFTNPLEFKKHLTYHALTQPPTYYSENSPNAKQIKGFGSHPCTQCPKVFKHNLDLELHQFHSHDTVSPGQQSTLPFLGEQELRAELKNFVLVKKASHKYICLKCNTKFNMRGQLVNHVKTVHLKIRKYKCMYCTADYKTKGTLNYHLKRHAEGIILKSLPNRVPTCNLFNFQTMILYKVTVSLQRNHLVVLFV